MSVTSAEPAREGLVLCDWSMFYCERGGGIRTYHRAKMEWFARQDRHQYVLVAPGPVSRTWHPSPGVTRVDVRSVTTGHGADGYRVPVGFMEMLGVLERFAPDVVEVNDPWVSGPLALLARRLGRLPALLTSFFHTDSAAAYIRPWQQRGWSAVPLRRAVGLVGERLFWRAQASYDWTLASSLAMRQLLRDHGVESVVVSPFGLEQAFLEPVRPRPPARLPVRLLYAGRLQPEKGIDLVLDNLDAILGAGVATLTIAGSGPFADRVASLARPDVTFVGYVADRQELRRLFDTHDVLLSPSPTETFGLTTLEAMARGLVVVGVDAGAIGDLMRQAASPFTFAAGHRASFVDAVVRALRSDRTDAATRGRRVAERHGSWADAVAAQVELYGHLVERRWTAMVGRVGRRQGVAVRS